MPNPRETPVPLQADTITTLPGGGIRTVVATVLVNGIPTPVQMQVVSLADADGVILDDFPAYNKSREILIELREIRRLIALALGVPDYTEGVGFERDGVRY